jgi:hypothetical protein
LEYQNNVNFNWGRRNSCYGGENEAGEGSSHECNFVGNYYKPGPAHSADNVFIELSNARKGKQLTSPSRWYMKDNVMEGQKVKDSWALVSNQTPFTIEQQKSAKRLQTPEYQRYLTKAESAKKAYRHVLERAGTIHRDAVERRIIEDVRSGQPQYQDLSARKPGIIDSPADADGWPRYAEAQPVVDNDHDGMADDWEVAHGLNPADPEDGKHVASAEGYTALEVYLNSLMGEAVKLIPTAIRTVVSANSEVVARQYFTADGRQVQRLQHGLNVIRETLSDGTTRTVKVVAK